MWILPSLSLLNAVNDGYGAVLRPGDSTLDSDKIIFSVDLHDLQILNGHFLSAEVSGHSLALIDPRRRGAGAHGTGMTVNGTCTVSLFKSCIVVTLDRTGVALTLAGAADIDDVALSEGVSLNDIAYIEAGDIVKSELLECSLECYVSLLEVACERLVYSLGSDLAEAQLNCLIAVVLNSLRPSCIG